MEVMTDPEKFILYENVSNIVALAVDFTGDFVVRSDDDITNDSPVDLNKKSEEENVTDPIAVLSALSFMDENDIIVAPEVNPEDSDADLKDGKKTVLKYVVTEKESDVTETEGNKVDVIDVNSSDKVVGTGGEIVGVPVRLLPILACLFTRLGNSRSVYTYHAITSNPNSSLTLPASMLCCRTLVKSCTCSKKPHAKCQDTVTLLLNDSITFPGPAVKIYFPSYCRPVPSASVLDKNIKFWSLEIKSDHFFIIKLFWASVKL